METALNKCFISSIVYILQVFSHGLHFFFVALLVQNIFCNKSFIDPCKQFWERFFSNWLQYEGDIFYAFYLNEFWKNKTRQDAVLLQNA